MRVVIKDDEGERVIEGEPPEVLLVLESMGEAMTLEAGECKPELGDCGECSEGCPNEKVEGLPPSGGMWKDGNFLGAQCGPSVIDLIDGSSFVAEAIAKHTEAEGKLYEIQKVKEAIREMENSVWRIRDKTLLDLFLNG